MQQKRFPTHVLVSIYQSLPVEQKHFLAVPEMTENRTYQELRVRIESESVP